MNFARKIKSNGAGFDLLSQAALLKRSVELRLDW
jgi:hypothetical protein